MKRKTVWVITCEHAVNHIPTKYTDLFSPSLLLSHRGYDRGAKEYASILAEDLCANFFCGKWSRLLVDLNRSSTSRHLFGEPLRTLPPFEKEKILHTYYVPYRKKVYEYISDRIHEGCPVIHLSCHTFTPKLRGKERPMDLGILYDPGRSGERAVAGVVKKELRDMTSLSLRLNAPYKGTSDGHTSALRLFFSLKEYIGIEIEFNQRVLGNPLWRSLWLPSLSRALQIAESICLQV